MIYFVKAYCMKRKKMQQIRKLVLYTSFVLLLFPSCKDPNNDGQVTCTGDFDQESMYTHVADNIIVPGYSALVEELDQLEEKSNRFAEEVNLSNLEQLQNQIFQTALAWQDVAQFDFGPAESELLKSSVNNFPLNLDDLQSNINMEGPLESTPETFHTGLPALDYLLFGVATDSNSVLDFYLDDANSATYLNYVKLVVAEMKSDATNTLESWNDNYRNEFVSNTGTAAGSALSLLINGFNKQYEIIKREKLGVPSGVLTLEIPNPDKAEAFYSDQSLALTVAALEASYNLYKGVGADGTDKIGFEEILQFVNAQKEETTLDALIQQQFDVALTTLRDLNARGNLTELIDTDQLSVIEAYNEVTKQLVNIKTDMPSVLCVSITYIDNPSDSD